MKYLCVSLLGLKALKVFLFGNWDKDKHEIGERKRRRKNWNIFLKKGCLRSVLTSSCLWSFTNNYTVHSLAILHKFTLHLVFLQNTLWFLRSEWATEEWF